MFFGVYMRMWGWSPNCIDDDDSVARERLT